MREDALKDIHLFRDKNSPYSIFIRRTLANKIEKVRPKMRNIYFTTTY